MTAVERLNYYNGRRLAAEDLRVEQQYHIAMRRLLNKGLFTSGVVNGLEVSRVDAKDMTHVVVAPGLALDPAGREMVLRDGPAQERTLAVPAQPPVTALGGYFLVLRYVEERISGAEDPCATPGGTPAARIRERAELVWTEDYPAHRRCDPLKTSIECSVVLALVTVTNACEIKGIETGVRQYSRPRNVSQVSAVGFEGDKDIDKDSPKTLRFQVRGGPPNAVTLYLWGDRFSSLHYTQLGEHDHTLKKGPFPLSPDKATFPDHKHGLGDHRHRPEGTNAAGHVRTEPADLSHRHQILTAHPHLDLSKTQDPYVGMSTFRADWSQVEYRDQSLHVGAPPVDPRPYLSQSLDADLRLEFALTLGGRVNPDGSPAPADTGGLAGPAVGDHDHSHSLTGDVKVSGSGSPQHPAGSTAAYEYFAGLKVELDGADVTAGILARVPTSWVQLGNGSATHQLVVDGTGALDLLEIANAAGKALEAGPHTLVFRVDASPGGGGNGGNILYNLYIE